MQTPDTVGWKELFDLFRQSRQQGPLTPELLSLIGHTEAAVKRLDSIEALKGLAYLKRFITELKPFIDDAQHGELQSFTDCQVLRKENLELKLQIARLAGATEDASQLEEAISHMGGFFLASISDLDSDFSRVG